MKVKSLNGEWQLLWNKTGEGKREGLDWSRAILCKVPGDVHQALTEHGVIEEPAYGLNSKKCKWLEEQEFWYQNFFEMDTDSYSEYAELVFEGLDLTADIWLNDTWLGHHNNAFTSAAYPVNGLLHKGTNTIIVRIDDGVFEASKKPLEQMNEMWNADQPYRAWMRKPQYVYGWDWTIWMPSCGIWKNVELRSYPEVIIRNTCVSEDWTKQKPVEGSRITLDISTELEQKNVSAPAQQVLVDFAVYADGRYEDQQLGELEKKLLVHTQQMVTLGSEQWKQAGSAGQGQQEVIGAAAPLIVLTAQLTIEAAKLWWPHLSGEPYLYEVQITVSTADGTLLDSTACRHGIRKAEIRESVLTTQELKEYGIVTVEPGVSDDREQKSFTFYINDTPIFCKGANHVPLDLFPGRVTPEKTRAYIQEVYDCNMNMIRIWGGGVYVTDAFLAQCDELGLMVWHDFMFACGYYPDFDGAYVDSVREEVRQALLMTRLHSCVIGWSGNNEIQEMYQNHVRYQGPIPWYGGTFYEKLLPEAIAAYSPNTFYRQSSPFGDPADPAGIAYGDQHVWHFTHRSGFEYYMDLWRFTDFNMKFLSEFGIAGAMDLSSVKKCISPEHHNPDDEEWLFHSNTSQEYQILNHMVDTYFGDHKQYSTERFIYLSQLLQAELTGHIFDEFQRRKFICSGLLFWTMGDDYGIHNWSLVDYYLRKKPVYRYLRRSLANLKLAIKGYEVQNSEGRAHYQDYFANATEPVEIWVINDSLKQETVTVRYQLLQMDGMVLAQGSQEIRAEANASARAVAVKLPEQFDPQRCVLLAWPEEEGKVSENSVHYFFAPYKEIEVEPAKLSVVIKEADAKGGTLGIIADTFVWMLHMDTDLELEFSDDAFDLIPGKEKLVHVSGECPRLQDIRFYAMNKLTVTDTGYME